VAQEAERNTAPAALADAPNGTTHWLSDGIEQRLAATGAGFVNSSRLLVQRRDKRVVAISDEVGGVRKEAHVAKEVNVRHVPFANGAQLQTWNPHGLVGLDHLQNFAQHNTGLNVAIFGSFYEQISDYWQDDEGHHVQKRSTTNAFSRIGSKYACVRQGIGA
jgi:hypothetical protein